MGSTTNISCTYHLMPNFSPSTVLRYVTTPHFTCHDCILLGSWPPSHVSIWTDWWGAIFHRVGICWCSRLPVEIRSHHFVFALLVCSSKLNYVAQQGREQHWSWRDDTSNHCHCRKLCSKLLWLWHQVVWASSLRGKNDAEYFPHVLHTPGFQQHCCLCHRPCDLRRHDVVLVVAPRMYLQQDGGPAAVFGFGHWKLMS